TVYAFPSELDAWWVDRRPRLGGDQPQPDVDPGAVAVDPSAVARRLPTLWIGIGAAVAVLAVGAVLAVRYWRPSIAPIRSVVVLPLDNLTGDPQQEYFADGTTD